MKVKDDVKGPILLVEDDEDLIETIKLYLESKNFFVVPYQSGREAVDNI